MENWAVFAITGCLLSAAVVYIVLDYRQHGERQEAMEKVLGAQASAHAIKKTLQSYTKYTDYLTPAKQAAIEHQRNLSSRVTRAYVHVEKVPSEDKNSKSTVTVIVNYSVDYVIGFDLKPEEFDISESSAGLDIRLKKPGLIGTPFIKNSSYEPPLGGTLSHEKDVVKAIYGKLPTLARHHAFGVSAEESIRALCEKKMLAHISAFLAGQPGVKQVPVMSLTFT